MKHAIIGLLLALFLLGTTLFFLKRRSQTATDDPTRPVSRELVIATDTLATWDEFFSRRGQQEAHKVVFVGIDGAAWSIIDPMIEAGLLPTLQKLKSEGSYGVLRSVECYVSPPAWATMMTGFLPNKTGVYTFAHWERKQQQFLSLSSYDVMTPSVWDVSSFIGKRTAVANVPVTYPVRDVDGIMVSGLLTPITLANRRAVPLAFSYADTNKAAGVQPASYSPIMRAAVDHQASRLEFVLCDTRDDDKARYDRVYVTVDRQGGMQREDGQTFSLDVGEHSPWLTVDYVDQGTTKNAWCKLRLMPASTSNAYVVTFSQTLLSASDSDLPFAYPDSLAIELQDEFRYYFTSKSVDKETVPGFTEDAARFASFFYDYDDWDLFLYVFTQTDNIQHIEGASSIAREVYGTIDRYLRDLVERLPDNATLVIASDHGFQEHTYGIDLNKFFEQNGLLQYRNAGEIDYDGSLVFHNLWCVYFNHTLLSRDELQRRGIEIGPGLSAEEALARHLMQIGRTVSAGDKGPRLPVEFAIVDASATGYAPDMIVKGSYNNYLLEFWNLKRPRNSVTWMLRPSEQWNHTREGIYLVYGKGIRKGFAGPVSHIEDIAPTMLYLLDAPVAPNMDGRVMTAILDARQFAGRTLNVVAQYDQARSDAIAKNDKRESVEKKLKSLGYIR